MPREARYSRIGNLLIAFASISCFSFTRFIGTIRGLIRRTGLEWFNNIYPRSGLNRPQRSIVEIGIVTVELILLDDHPLVLQKDFELLGLVDAERMADGGIAALQPSDKRRIGNTVGFGEQQFQRLAVLGLADLGIVETFGSGSLPKLVVLDLLGQGIGVDAKGERLEIPVADVHRRNGTYIAVEVVFGNLQHGFGLVVQLRAQMPARVVVALVQMQHRMDVDAPLVRPLHQLRDEVGRLAGAVDVVRQIADAVDNDQSEVVEVVDCLLDLPQPLFGGITAQAQELQQWRMHIGRQSRQPQNPAQHPLAMEAALLRIDVEDAPPLRRQRGRIVQHRAAGHGCRHDCADIERLLALRLAGRSAEIPQSPDNRIIHPQNHGRSRELIRNEQTGRTPRRNRNRSGITLRIHRYFFFEERPSRYCCASASICACVLTGLRRNHASNSVRSK